jgi:exopolysaccharide biosynthesis polyprenyl glycosylphosphotransferase
VQLLDDLRTIAGATAIAAMATTALPVLAGASGPALPGQGLRIWLFATVYLTASRSGLMASLVASRRAGGRAPTLIVGAGSVGRLIAKRFSDHPELGLAPVGFIDKEPRRPHPGEATLPVLGASWDMPDIIDTYGIEHVVFTFSTAPHDVMLRMVDECHRRGARVTLVPRLFERMPRNLTVDYLGAIPLVTVHPSDPRALRMHVKYACDRVLAAISIALLWPLLAAVALAVAISIGRPIFFRQKRIGLDGRVFEMLKFRTMRGSPDLNGEADTAWAISQLDPAAGNGLALREDAARATRLGSALRRFSLDELPQLFNVVRGDMSLVGPRPERASYVELFAESFHRYGDRHRVKAGITGWAQINGLRGETSLADRIEWDNWYIENWSPWLDLKIMLKTFVAVARTRTV